MNIKLYLDENYRENYLKHSNKILLQFNEIYEDAQSIINDLNKTGGKNGIC